MVGLFSYNPPAILKALGDNDKLDKIKVIAFDEDEDTLNAIAKGHCTGSVVLNPYAWVYHAVRIGAAQSRGQAVKLDKKGAYNIAPILVTKENVAQLQAFLAGKADTPPKSGKINSKSHK